MKFNWNNRVILEKKIEENIKDAYASWDRIRCYNLLRLMVKVNINNKILLKYIDKFDDKKLKKYYKEWAIINNNGWFTLKGFLKSPKAILSIILLTVFFRFK